jgi:hypothetical protein
VVGDNHALHGGAGCAAIGFITIEIDENPLSLLHEAPKGITPLWAIVLNVTSGAALLTAGGALLHGCDRR